jgi:hypothetical protein
MKFNGLNISLGRPYARARQILPGETASLAACGALGTGRRT